MADKKKSILIIDDEKEILDSLSDYLQRNGYDVETVDNGLEGLEIARTRRPDLIILDLILPDIDGSDVAAKLLEDPLMRKTSVIFLTGIMRKSELEQSGPVVAKRCIVAKPCSPEEILARVKVQIGPA
ncbi:MAG: response regulator [Candidatus Omnitrophica bacterium]|nr:response regulator [Candidatus Omnitrophota bacterium]MDD5574421.1 response regulator [Candidatus Omnitrophota bacterium]